METNVQSASTTSWQAIGKFATYTFTAPISIVIFLTIHENIHIITGRALGLPMRMMTLTSSDLDPLARVNVAQIAPVSLALIAGIAPCVSFLMGVVSFLLVVTYGPRIPDLLRRFLTWWALFGVPYGSTQLMFTSLAVGGRYLGNDFADVALHLGWPHWLDIALTLIGLCTFILSCFWLRLPLGVADDQPSTPRLQLRVVPTSLRHILALIFGIALVGSVVIGTILLAQNNARGENLIDSLAADILCPAIAALLLPWRTPGATLVRDRWLFPGLVGCLLLFFVGLFFSGSDYFVMTFLILPQIFIAAWAQAATIPTVPATA